MQWGSFPPRVLYDVTPRQVIGKWLVVRAEEKLKNVKLANYQTDSTCKLLSSLESRQVLQLDSLTVYQLYNNQPF